MIKDLHFWVQKVLPLVYDDSLSYYELLAKVVKKLNEVINVTNDLSKTITQDVTNIMNEWLEDGTLADIIGSTLSDLDDRVDDLESSDAAQNSAISDIQTAVTAAQGNISDLQSAIKFMDPVRLKGQGIVFFGDSWTVGGSASIQANRFSSQLASMLGMTEHNYGVGGAGFTRPGNLISSQITTAATEMSTSARAAIPVVVICGGVNDLRNMDVTDQTEFMTNAAATCQAAHTAFPNALIVAVVSNTTLSGMTPEKLRWITAAQERIQYHQSYPVIVPTDCFNWVRNRVTWYQSDGLHLSDLGHGVWANRIAQAICGCTTQIFDHVATVSLQSGITTSDDLSLYAFKHGAYLTLQTIPLTFTTPVTEQTLIATVPAECAPMKNAYGIFAYGNTIVGCVAVTTAGNIYLTPLGGVASISQGYFAGAQYLLT